jgi:hypothetical protein
MGFWTPDNEAWFQRRLDDIRLGIAQPRSASDWVSHLKGYKWSLNAKHSIAAASADAFSEVVS